MFIEKPAASKNTPLITVVLPAVLECVESDGQYGRLFSRFCHLL